MSLHFLQAGSTIPLCCLYYLNAQFYEQVYEQYFCFLNEMPISPSLWAWLTWGIARFWSAIRWTLHEEQEFGLSSVCTITLSSTQTLSVCKITDTPNITSNNPLQPLLLFCIAMSNPAEAQFQLIYLGKYCRFFVWRKEAENRKNSVPHQQFQLSDNLGLEASSLERICY